MEATVATKADFTADEWAKVLSSPMMAGMAVSLADPSGLWGMLQEGLASGRALVEAKSDPASNDLVKATVADLETSEGRSAAREGIRAQLAGKSAVEMKSLVLAELREVGALLDAKAPA